jgi:hypothetical protein
MSNQLLVRGGPHYNGANMITSHRPLCHLQIHRYGCESRNRQYLRNDLFAATKTLHFFIYRFRPETPLIIYAVSSSRVSPDPPFGGLSPLVLDLVISAPFFLNPLVVDIPCCDICPPRRRGPGIPSLNFSSIHHKMSTFLRCSGSAVFRTCYSLYAGISPARTRR